MAEKKSLNSPELIDYSEEVIYLGDPIPQEEIKSFLINAATEKF